jgi:virginiamycin B lyase
VITEFPIPGGGGVPVDITAGPDGNLWFTEITGNKIGKASVCTGPTINTLAATPNTLSATNRLTAMGIG